VNDSPSRLRKPIRKNNFLDTSFRFRRLHLRGRCVVHWRCSLMEATAHDRVGLSRNCRSSVVSRLSHSPSEMAWQPLPIRGKSGTHREIGSFKWTRTRLPRLSTCALLTPAQVSAGCYYSGPRRHRPFRRFEWTSRMRNGKVGLSTLAAFGDSLTVP